MALLSPKLARTSAPAAAAPAAAALQLLGGADEAEAAGASAAGPMDLCRGLTSRIISLCISPFRAARPAAAADEQEQEQEQAAPLLGAWAVPAAAPGPQ